MNGAVVVVVVTYGVVVVVVVGVTDPQTARHWSIEPYDPNCTSPAKHLLYLHQYVNPDRQHLYDIGVVVVVAHGVVVVVVPSPSSTAYETQPLIKTIEQSASAISDIFFIQSLFFPEQT